jgi:mannose-6-phosphate isomerase
MFLAANEPHAYLSGDLAECMACSDNVIRSGNAGQQRINSVRVLTGLTPKFKDVDLLCECLTYQTGAAPIERGQQVDQHTRLFTPPVPEFEMIITSKSRLGSWALTVVLAVLSRSGVLRRIPYQPKSLSHAHSGSRSR